MIPAAQGGSSVCRRETSQPALNPGDRLIKRPGETAPAKID
jgi:hypothetical protein